MLGGGLAGSKVLDQKRQNMLDRSFEPGFRIELHHKDLGIVTSAAREAGVVIPLGALVAQLMASRQRRRRRRTRPLRRCCAAWSDSADAEPTSSTHIRTTERTPMPRMRAVDAAVLILEKEGATQAFGLPGRRDQPVLQRHAGARRDQARAGPARRGRLAHGRGLHPGQGGQHRRLHRHLRPGRHRHDHRALLGVRRLHPDPLHHRAGTGGQAAQGGLPGGRHRRHRQARRPSGRSRCWRPRRCPARSRRRSS